MSGLFSNLNISRKAATWLAFGATGVATGAVWASGFASISPTSNAAAESPAMAKTAPGNSTSALNGKAAPVDALVFDWDGRWGKVTTPKVMFKVDLTGPEYAGTKEYNVAVLLSKTSVLTGWATLQLEFERVQEAASGTCDAADFDGATNTRVLNVDDQDAAVYWNNLPGNAVHCIGVDTSTGDDHTGTFLRSAQDSEPTGHPLFIATVDRAA
ncbi:hypothetical protein DVA67_012825 [Solirubrobacter sp. CPCC 204708]|uniref:DNRLRE domain-containing protein n=1 Tax=Solirubrobacter deserti TaxID=2282478 RepID=A0ABT4RKW6_9ACTN|nr:hypothetical protein [Solirubrobacter deserti]MBE2316858.1 hypothetical protein [Solirubrobacter deserti]MDA0138925.1 hypothetical protein [Solirubrobacter deserti]